MRTNQSHFLAADDAAADAQIAELGLTPLPMTETPEEMARRQAALKTIATKTSVAEVENLAAATLLPPEAKEDLTARLKAFQASGA